MYLPFLIIHGIGVLLWARWLERFRGRQERLLPNRIIPWEASWPEVALFLWGGLMAALVPQYVAEGGFWLAHKAGWITASGPVSPERLPLFRELLPQAGWLVYAALCLGPAEILRGRPEEEPRSFWKTLLGRQALAGGRPAIGQLVKQGLEGFCMAMPLLWLAGMLWGLLLTAITVLVHFLWPAEELEFALQPFVQKMQGGMPLQQLLAMVILVGVLAPVVEEALFRGILYRMLRSRLGQQWALVASAVFFAAIHMNVASFGLLLVLGLMLGRLYEATGSLLPPIILHACVNLQTVLLLQVVSP